MVENITIIKGTDGPTAVFWRKKSQIYAQTEKNKEIYI